MSAEGGRRRVVHRQEAVAGPRSSPACPPVRSCPELSGAVCRGVFVRPCRRRVPGRRHSEAALPPSGACLALIFGRLADTGGGGGASHLHRIDAGRYTHHQAAGTSTVAATAVNTTTTASVCATTYWFVYWAFTTLQLLRSFERQLPPPTKISATGHFSSLI